MNFGKEITSLRLKYRDDATATQALREAYQLYFAYLSDIYEMLTRNRKNVPVVGSGVNDVC
jgi:hypothetical protein